MPTMLFQPGPAEANDTYLDSGYPSANYGSANLLRLGRYEFRGVLWFRPLLRWTLPALPNGAMLLSARLYLTNSGAASQYDQTVYVYRCPTDWTEFGATWAVRDGVNPWNNPAGGGDWDEFPVASASATAFGDLMLDITPHVDDARAHRGGVLNLLLKTAETRIDSATYWSSDETLESRRPRLEIEYRQTGYRLYAGDGGPEDVDWTEPIAVFPPGETTAALSLPLLPGRTRTLAARRVSEAGVEEHSTHVFTPVEIDAEGALLPPPLPRAFDLSFERVAADRIRLGFSHEPVLGQAEPTAWEIFGDSGTGTMNLQTPEATISEHVAGRREFIVELSAPTFPRQWAVRARRDERVGPLSPVLLVPAGPSPEAPSLLPSP